MSLIAPSELRIPVGICGLVLTQLNCCYVIYNRFEHRPIEVLVIMISFRCYNETKLSIKIFDTIYGIHVHLRVFNGTNTVNSIVLVPGPEVDSRYTNMHIV